MKCDDCKKEVEGIERISGAETDFEPMNLCEYCQERRYNKYHGINKEPEPESGDEGLCG